MHLLLHRAVGGGGGGGAAAAHLYGPASIPFMQLPARIFAPASNSNSNTRSPQDFRLNQGLSVRNAALCLR
jgi:hypothetical protein